MVVSKLQERNQKSIVYPDTQVSYDNMLKLFRQGLEKIGENGMLFTLHSVRTGAVSEATNSGTCDRESITVQYVIVFNNATLFQTPHSSQLGTESVPRTRGPRLFLNVWSGDDVKSL